MSLSPHTHYGSPGVEIRPEMIAPAQLSAKLSTHDQLVMKINHSVLSELISFGWSGTERSKYRIALAELLKRTHCKYLVLNTLGDRTGAQKTAANPGVILFTPQASRRAASVHTTAWQRAALGSARGVNLSFASPIGAPYSAQPDELLTASAPSPRFRESGAADTAPDARLDVPSAELRPATRFDVGLDVQAVRPAGRAGDTPLPRRMQEGFKAFSATQHTRGRA